MLPKVFALAEGYSPELPPDPRSYAAFDLSSREAPEFSQRVGSTAIVPVSGFLSRTPSLARIFFGIGGPTLPELEAEIEALAADQSVERIVLRINSPGGEVDGVREAAAAIAKAAGVKPVVAAVDGLAASAAYWLASAASQVVATETSRVGSIGTFGVLMDTTKAQEKAGVKLVTVSSGRFKGLGADGEVSEDLVAEVQRTISGLNELFVNDVASARGVSVDTARAQWNDGRVHLAAPAQKLGLIDGIGTVKGLLKAQGGTIMKSNEKTLAEGVLPEAGDDPRIDELKAQVSQLTELVGSVAQVVQTQAQAAEEASLARKERAITATLDGLVRSGQILPSQRETYAKVLQTANDEDAQALIRQLQSQAPSFGAEETDLPSESLAARNQLRMPKKVTKAFTFPPGKGQPRSKVDRNFAILHEAAVQAARESSAKPGTDEWYAVYRRAVESTLTDSSVEIY